MEHAPAVVVLALEGERALGVSQYRPAIGRTTWELPAGLVDPDETPERAAARELAEETGLTGQVELVTRMFSSPGFTDEEIFLFRATELRPHEAEPDPAEELTVTWQEVDAVWEAVQAGELATSAPTVAGLLYARALLGRG